MVLTFTVTYISICVEWLLILSYLLCLSCTQAKKHVAVSSKKTTVYIGFWKFCTAAVHVDTVSNIHNFGLQLHILADLILKKIFFSICVFFHTHSRITGLQEKGKGISLTPHYHFHPLHRHLDISRGIAAKSSSLHIGSSQTRTRNLWFPSARG